MADDPDSAVVDVLARADERGVDVRGLIWRSHWDKIGFFARENRTLGEELQDRGAEALLDMRVRNGGSHHQKFVVIRHRDDPTRDIAFVGGIDLAHSRRDDERHLGDPQPSRWPRSTASTRPGTTCRSPSRAGRARRGDHVPRALGGPGAPQPQAELLARRQDPRLDRSPDPLPPQSRHLRHRSRAAPTSSSCCGPTRSPAGARLPVRHGGERSVARGYRRRSSGRGG